MKTNSTTAAIHNILQQNATELGWRFMSQELIHAANCLYENYQRGVERNTARDTSEVPIGDTRLTGEEEVDYMDELLSRPYLLLAGFALENLLKDLFNQTLPKVKEPTGPKEQLFTHNLLVLASKILYNPSQEEREVLELLTDMIQWAGRYPSSRSFAGVTHRHGLSPAEMKSIKGIIDNLLSRLNKRIRETAAKVD